MGNCLFGGMGDGNGGGGGGGGVIKVITYNGGIMEFYEPMTAGCITNEFSGHAIFPSDDLFWRPLSHHEELHAGQSYYLLPLTKDTKICGQLVKEGHVRSKSIPTTAAAATASLVDAAPYRMSLDYQGLLKRSYTEVFSRCDHHHNVYNNKKGFWKVKLAISPEQLLQILSQEGRTQELIENVRAVAKCGNGMVISSSSASASANSIGFSDQWSLSSSRNASSSKKDGLVDI